MPYRFTVADIEQLEATVLPHVQKHVAEVIAPHVARILGAYLTKGEAYTVGKLVGWVVLAGKDKLRMLPQYFMDTMSFSEGVAYTFADMIIAECQTEMLKILQGVDIAAFRLPWKSKINPAALDALRAKPQKPEEEKKPEHNVEEFIAKPKKDAEDKLAIRLRMIEQLAGIEFTGDMAERFRHVVRPAIAGIKDEREVVRQLSLVPEKGGLGMSQSHVDEVMNLIERLRAKEREIASRAGMQKPQTPKSFLPMVEDEEKMMPMASIKQNSIVPTASVLQNDSDKKKLDTLIKQQAADSPVNLQAFAANKMHDVVARPLTMGPVEELRTMTLTDFRRLAAKAGAAAEKIKQRLAVLREDGVDQYAAGIRAWRESPLYGVYITMIHEGLQNGQPIDALVSLNPNDPARLTSEELKNIVELNKSLRF